MESLNETEQGKLKGGIQVLTNIGDDDDDDTEVTNRFICINRCN